MESAQPGVGMPLLGRGRRPARRVRVRVLVLAGVDAHVLVESG